MLKMAAGGNTTDGKPFHLVVIGLSFENLKRLKAGRPIECTGADFGLSDEIKILIFSGETERSMARELESLIGPKTQVRIDPRLRD